MPNKFNCLLLLFVALAILFSCKNNQNENLRAFRLLYESLSNSNQKINISSDQISLVLKEKLQERGTKEKGMVWWPRGEEVMQLSRSMTDYIDELEIQLKDKADLQATSGKEIFDENRRLANSFFDQTGNILANKLFEYKNNVLEVDSLIKLQFENSVFVVDTDFDKSVEKDLTKNYFHDIPIVASLALLERLKNNVRTMENRILTFCLEHCTAQIHNYTTYELLAAQSSSCIIAGKKIEITAGLASINSWETSPEVLINNKRITSEENGLVHYSYFVSKKPGKYQLPVEIRFTSLDEQKLRKKFIVEYSVIDTVRRHD